MDELPTYVSRLLRDGMMPLSEVSASARLDLRPLLDGGALVIEDVGRGQRIAVRRRDVVVDWACRNFPAFSGEWTLPAGKGRARGIALRKDSKAGAMGTGSGILHLRALDGVRASLDQREFPIAELTRAHGVAACAIRPGTVLEIHGRAGLIENLTCFVHAEAIAPELSVALNSAGRISGLLIECLARSSFTPEPLLHLPDYDPVGLADYLRLKDALGARVELYAPHDLEQRFAAHANRALVVEKPRSRGLLEQLTETKWPCEASARVFRLIREHGAGLEQESLLLERRSRNKLTT